MFGRTPFAGRGLMTLALVAGMVTVSAALVFFAPGHAFALLFVSLAIAALAVVGSAVIGRDWVAAGIGLSFILVAGMVIVVLLRQPTGQPVSAFPVAGAPGGTLGGYSDAFAAVCKGLRVDGVARLFDAAPTAEDMARAAAAGKAPEGPWRHAAYQGCLRGLGGR